MMRRIHSFQSLPITTMLLFFFLNIFAAAAAASNTSSSDQNALLAFRDHLTLDPGNRLATNWSANADFCRWVGVTCNPIVQRVTALNLTDMGLQGAIHPDISNLSFLTVLNLRNNSFHGPLPPELTHLTRLTYINLGENYFAEEIPPWFGSFPKLEDLILPNSYFSGTIPPSLSNVSTLKTLTLYNNNLTGIIPSSIFNIPALQMIDVAFNKLSGTLPDDMCDHVPNLQRLIVHHNRLVGHIPSSLSKCKQLLRISVDNNKFNGPIPRNLGNLTLLQELYFADNNLTGGIPEEIGSLPALERFWIQNNGIEGSIPRGLFNATSIWDLSMGGNEITGPVPTEIGKLQNLQMFSLISNSLSGQIPNALFNITTINTIELSGNKLSGNLQPGLFLGVPNLEELYLWGNQLNGTLPSSISNASNLTILELSGNSFSGSIPNSIGDLRNLQRINIGENQFTDESSGPELSFITSLTNCRELIRVVLSGNPFNGFLPASTGNFSSALEYFNAESCQIKGSIPTEIGSLKGLITLLLQNNSLTGMIPNTIGNLQKLQVLHLEENELDETMPSDICRLTNLGELYLRENKLHGSIPACLGDITSLRILHLGSNNFSSAIPSALWNLKDTLDLNLSSNSFSGHLDFGIGNLKVVTKVDLSSNQFSGVIPSNMGGLQNLMILSLAHNRFQGPIPESFGNMISMESMDLSNNNLSGSIPQSLEKLKQLTYLNVSFNGLEGEIPTRGPFAKFSAQSFLGNAALCSGNLPEFSPCKTSTRGQRRNSNHHILKYVLPAIILTIFFIVIAFMVGRYRKGSAQLRSELDTITLATWRRITYQELQQATDSFCESNILGTGGFGTVYKGRLSDGTEVAVKVISLQSEAASKTFDTECEVMSNIRHRNLVKIISSCHNGVDFLALILEYMPNGSLEKWLYSYNYCLDILQRLNIMIDVASALEYLHHSFFNPIVHCDLKPSNILLDNNMVAHVGDFGIAKLLGEEDSMIQTKTLATIGYMAPEYGSEGIVSTKGDVYSFGILLMETFTRKKPTDDTFIEGMSLRQYVQEALPDAAGEVADANLVAGEEHWLPKKDCIFSVLSLAVDCSTASAIKRIDMREALARLRTWELDSSALRYALGEEDNGDDA